MIRFAQRLLRAAFMRVERLFNHAFGDKLNPLYHLGATAFLLFWIVGGTGLYLFAFFDTSVDGAYRSVQALSERQWWAGGVMRSVHRYASDAMVAVMVVHLLRHFAFDRLRGFRAFSWITGVVLIVLVGVAGAGGYMLPWDRLAQYVTQASFEWLDALPGFGGTLSRNFIVPESVSNRLFSLLVFIHIGVPLVTLLLIWVHVQRVPKAAMLPPKPFGWATLAMTMVLALAAPVASQGGAAQLLQLPTSLELDWFLLGLYPLVDLWPLERLWAVVGVGFAILLLLPWLPPARRRGAPLVTLHPGPAQIRAREGETILEAGLRAGLALPYDCRAGGCGLCRCTVLQGRVDLGAYQVEALSAAAREAGGALMCCAVALEDVEIDVGVESLGAAATPRRWQARVAVMERLTDDLMRLELELPAGEAITFRAGQYINIILSDGAKRAFSFANPPHEAGRIELHVRRIPGGRFTGEVFTTMKVGDAIDFEGPLGRFTLQEGEAPILFVAGATGFAPVKSIVEDALHRGVKRPMQLYWGVRKREDLYQLARAEAWARDHPNVRVIPVLSEPDDRWTGRRGLVHEVMLQDHPDLRGFEVYACGSTQMVHSAVPDFIAHGLAEDRCFSDAFAPAPVA